MAELNLTQTEADSLIQIEKHRVDDTEWEFSGLAGSLEIPLISVNRKETFSLDIWKSEISLKGRYQTRGRKIIVLIRLDFGGQPHRNPDGTEIPSPHLHIYKEGYADKWAIPIPTNQFSDINDLWQTLQDFMKYCNITKPPEIRRGLWI
jgi:hypothetical protein